MKKFRELLNRIKINKRGQGMVEYGLILAAVALAAIVTMTPVGTAVADIFNSLAQSIGGVTPSG